MTCGQLSVPDTWIWWTHCDGFEAWALGGRLSNVMHHEVGAPGARPNRQQTLEILALRHTAD
jgi:hypothetical protein